MRLEPVDVFQMLCAFHMSRSATLPPIRVEPETKASLEAVLRKGESLTQFIESAVCREAEFRAEQNAAVARAKKALRSADRGEGLTTPEDTCLFRCRGAVERALGILAFSPQTCRRCESQREFRELIIPFGRGGCVVLFAIRDLDVVLLAARDQHERDDR